MITSIEIDDLDLTVAPFLWSREEGANDFGDPSVAVEDVESLMAIGSLVRPGGASNRAIGIRVAIEAATLAELDAAEQVLVRACSKQRTTLTLRLDDGRPASVFDVYLPQLKYEYSPMGEAALLREYLIEMVALPYPRSEFLTSTPAVSGSAPVTTVVDSGASATGWSSTSGSVSSVAGVITLAFTTHPIAVLSRAAAVAMSTDTYLVIDWKCSVPVYYDLTLLGPSKSAPKALTIPLPGGYTRTYFSATGAELTGGFRFDIAHGSTAGGTLQIDQVFRSDKLPDLGNGRQRLMSLTPGGSAPTEGTIYVQHPTEALGPTIVITYPTSLGYYPPITSQYFSAGSRTANAAALSGYIYDLNTLAEFLIPVDRVPRGRYVVLIRAVNTTAGAAKLHWNVSSRLGTTQVGPGSADLTTLAMPQNVWMTVPLTAVTLPDTAIGQAGFIRIALQNDTGIPMQLDEIWLVHEDADLTSVDAGMGALAPGLVSNRLRITAATPDEPTTQILLANAANWSDEYGAGSRANARAASHVMHPEGMNIFVSSVATSPAVSLEHYKRWVHHAAEDS